MTDAEIAVLVHGSMHKDFERRYPVDRYDFFPPATHRREYLEKNNG